MLGFYESQGEQARQKRPDEAARPGERCGKWIMEGTISETCKKPRHHTGLCGGFTQGNTVKPAKKEKP